MTPTFASNQKTHRHTFYDSRRLTACCISLFAIVPAAASAQTPSGGPDAGPTAAVPSEAGTQPSTAAPVSSATPGTAAAPAQPPGSASSPPQPAGSAYPPPPAGSAQPGYVPPSGAASASTRQQAGANAPNARYASLAAGFSGLDGARVIFSADRLFGVWSWNSTASTTAGTTTAEGEASGTMVNVLWGNSSTGAGINVSAIPRLGVDAFIGNLTLGGSLGFMSSSGSSKAIGAATSTDLPDASTFVISPRVGYAIALGEYVALWLRGGITYYSSSADQAVDNGTVTVSASGSMLTLDPQFVILPIPNAGITVGPVVEIGLGGSVEVQSPNLPTLSVDTTESTFGVGAGLLLYF